MAFDLENVVLLTSKGFSDKTVQNFRIINTPRYKLPLPRPSSGELLCTPLNETKKYFNNLSTKLFVGHNVDVNTAK